MRRCTERASEITICGSWKLNFQCVRDLVGYPKKGGQWHDRHTKVNDIDSLLKDAANFGSKVRGGFKVLGNKVRIGWI